MSGGGPGKAGERVAERAPILAVIMAGGSGERFWPLSSPAKPKQVLRIWGDRTLLQAAAARAATLAPWDRVLVVAGRPHEGVIRDQLPEVPPENFLFEPVARDTAGCVAFAVGVAGARDPGAVMAVMPADHLIDPPEAFAADVRRAAEIASTGETLVTLGIRPSRPETGYGYIQRGAPLTEAGGAYRVAQFKEKPDAATAAEFLADGGYYWNSGIFVWQVAVIRSCLESFLPAHAAAARAVGRAWGTPRAREVLEAEFQRLPKISIDYGVLERAPEVVVVPAGFTWDDLGAWPSLERLFPPDAQGNVVRGQHVGIETEDCIVVSSGRPIGTIGVKGLIVVEGEYGVLICPKDRAQEVKTIIRRLGG